MGSPLIMQATGACADDSHPITAKAQARMKAGSRRKNRLVMVIFAMLADPDCRNAVLSIHPPKRVPKPALLRCRVGIGKSPQAELQHESVAEYWRRSRRRVGEGRDVVGRQHEAVVHIAGAHDVLVDLVGYKIPPRSSRRHPIRGHLDRSADENAFATRQIS